MLPPFLRLKKLGTKRNLPTAPRAQGTPCQGAVSLSGRQKERFTNLGKRSRRCAPYPSLADTDTKREQWFTESFDDLWSQ
ncbi:MAG: hypothetical protein CMJ78_21540 [Planctomycetaceae bacterium]|nr:hypothetical protein [Planctomycetaceae bacterium]